MARDDIIVPGPPQRARAPMRKTTIGTRLPETVAAVAAQFPDEWDELVIKTDRTDGTVLIEVQIGEHRVGFGLKEEEFKNFDPAHVERVRAVLIKQRRDHGEQVEDAP